MIHLLPYLEEQINSEKAPEDIYMVLKSVTDSRKAVLFTNEEFIGQVYPHGFRIYPKVNGRNSFRPILTGKMTKNEGGTTIDITLQMHIITRVFLVVWFSMACFYFLCGILVVFTNGLEEITLIIVSLGFLIFGQILMRCGFYGPAGKALKRLRELLC